MKKLLIGFLVAAACGIGCLVLFVVVLRAAAGFFFGGPAFEKTASRTGSVAYQNIAMQESGGPVGMMAADAAVLPVPADAAPTVGQPRLVVHNATLAIVVAKVADVVRAIEDAAVRSGGYMVDSSVSTPEGASSGSVTIRVPVEKREETLRAIKALGVKTTSETVTGNDVTDQYTDNKARLDVLLKTKTKFEKIQESATAVQDLLNVQQQLLSVQSQIDAVKGQQAYLEGNAKLSRITVYLSTDEFALPYSPDTAWRPEVVFKQAVRSMVGMLRGIADAGIWIAVYAPFWLVPLAIVILAVRRKGTVQ